MSLHADYQALMGELGNKVPAEMMARVMALIERLARDGVASGARKVGDISPRFELVDTTGHIVALSTLIARGPVVVAFFRGEWCPFCDLELRALQTIVPELAAHGASLVAISPQIPENNRSSSQTRSLGFQVLSDPGNAVAKSFGIAFSLTTDEEDLHRAFGADLPTVNGCPAWDLPVPATFVIDISGRIAWAHVDSNYTKRAEPSDVVSAVAAIVRTH